MTKIKLTKKRLRDLDTVLSIDEVLYEKFRRLNEDLQKQKERFYRSKQVVSVFQLRGDSWYAIKIERVEVTPEGIRVFCR